MGSEYENFGCDINSHVIVNLNYPYLDNGLLAVDAVLLQLVRQHALDRLAVVGLGNLLDCFCDRVGLKSKHFASKARSHQV